MAEGVGGCGVGGYWAGVRGTGGMPGARRARGRGVRGRRAGGAGGVPGGPVEPGVKGYEAGVQGARGLPGAVEPGARGRRGTGSACGALAKYPGPRRARGQGVRGRRARCWRSTRAVQPGARRYRTGVQGARGVAGAPSSHGPGSTRSACGALAEYQGPPSHGSGGRGRRAGTKSRRRSDPRSRESDGSECRCARGGPQPARPTPGQRRDPLEQRLADATRWTGPHRHPDPSHLPRPRPPRPVTPPSAPHPAAPRHHRSHLG